MAVTDEQIGRNLALLRGDMSQKDLADKMRASGWRWSQATVWSVEKGERPLRLAEAEALAAILGTTSVSSLTTTTHGAVIERAVEDQRARERALRAAMNDYLNGQRELAGYASLIGIDHEINPHFASEIEWAVTFTPEDIAREVRTDIRHRAESREDLELALLSNEDDRALYREHLEDDYKFDRALKYNQLLDESWDKALGEYPTET